MKNFLKVTLFSLLLISLFSLYSNYGIPEIQPAPPPTEEKLDLGSMSMEQFIAVGEKIVSGKGTCTLCHNELGRAPLLEELVTATPKRLQDSRYQGEASDLESYILESMVDPSIYVVVGFGKAGSNDTESPMPNVTGGGINLSEAEISAVIAYLQDLGGADVTVEIPTGTAAEDSTETVTSKAQPLGSAEEIVASYGCGACHKIAGQSGAIGPDLSSIGETRDSDYLRRAILDPNAEIAEGYPPNLMPATYGSQFYAQELELLVAYMNASVGSAGGQTETAVDTAPQAVSGSDGESLMTRHGCGACHKFGTQVGAIGPDLSDIGASRDADFLRRSIVDPNADITEGYMSNLMPPIYAAQLSTEELELIVKYLTGLK
ncbi:MAG: c-type cytochrome [Gammaproteobacteria bacterium]|nr:c-type cytochrome [Gammaproteobacteria bacterium]